MQVSFYAGVRGGVEALAGLARLKARLQVGNLQPALRLSSPLFKSENASTPQTSMAGQSMVEFALVIPVLLLLIFGILEFGRAFYAYSAIANAAREGARYGVVDPMNAEGIKNQAITTAIALGLTHDDIRVSCSPSCTSGNPIRVDVTYNFQSVIPLVTPSLTLQTAATMYIE